MVAGREVSLLVREPFGLLGSPPRWFHIGVTTERLTILRPGPELTALKAKAKTGLSLFSLPAMMSDEWPEAELS